MRKYAILVYGLAVIALVGCESEDSPTQELNSTITVVNLTQSTITVAYQTQTWDVILDISHEETADIEPSQDPDLPVYFAHSPGSSNITVTKGDFQKTFKVGHGTKYLTISEDDFISK